VNFEIFTAGGFRAEPAGAPSSLKTPDTFRMLKMSQKCCFCIGFFLDSAGELVADRMS